MSLTIYNTLSRNIEEFDPLNPDFVSFYTCGFTVYDKAHIGSLRKYTGDDMIKRVLQYNGYTVKHVQNVTDVGHLVSDEDAGEDKMEKGAKKHGKTVWEVAKYYEKHFYDSLAYMNLISPDIICRATEHIDAQIELVKKLEEKGFTYDTPEAVYFDVSKFSSYGQLSGQSLDEKIVGAREEVVTDTNKKHPADFALWIKRVGEHANHTMHWPSPWGDGFPGWHIECSAMAMQYLGPEIDIHTGGVDHIPVHHENEIAQSEAATDKHFVRYWVHHEFLNVDNTKMSKSLGNLYTIEDIIEHKFDPMALKYLFYTAHYRQKLNFTWEALEGAQNSLNNLYKLVTEKKNTKRVEDYGFAAEVQESREKELKDKFMDAINDDFSMPKALAVLWEALKDEHVSYEFIVELDKVFALKLDDVKEKKITKKALDMAKKRDALRKEGNYAEADALRDALIALGYVVEDTKEGTRIS